MPTTLGSFISAERKKLGLSQKELAQKILREEDGNAISPQYLNDIERDRRQPSSDHILQQFGNVLGCDIEFLHFLSGTLPAYARESDKSPEEVVEIFKAFRKS